MAWARLLFASLAALTLACGPWLAHAAEREPISDTALRSLPLPSHRLPSDPAAATTGLLTGQKKPASQQGPQNDSYCLTCHSNPFLLTRFSDGQPLALHVDAGELRDSAHNLVTCSTCHQDYADCPPVREEPLSQDAYRAAATEICVRCHLAGAGGYAESAHGEPVLSATGAGATCIDCHSPEFSGHAVTPVDDPRAALAPDVVHENCGRCHEEELDSYRQTSHYKVARFGDPRRPATCTTCHGEHRVQAVDGPEDPLTAGNLIAVCGRCHSGADESFAGEWLGHTTTPSRAAGFFYVERFIVFSLTAGVAVGLLHMTLDLLRTLVGGSGPTGASGE